MKICPVCREEYFDHIETCSPCNSPLVFPADMPNKPLMDKAALLEGETVVLLEGGITQCREIEKLLEVAQICSVAYPKNLATEQAEQVLGTAGEKKYLLLIKPEDVERAKQALEGQFLASVAKEGKGSAAHEAIDLEQAEVTCPACQETGPLKNGECASCGLMLAVGH